MLLPAVAAAAAAVLAAAVAAAAGRGRCGDGGGHDHLGGVGLVVGPVQEERHRELGRVDLVLLVLEDLGKQ